MDKFILTNDNIDQRGRPSSSQKGAAEGLLGGLQATRRLCGRKQLLRQKVNDKILGRLQLVQHVYYEDYKDQVKQMSDELKKLKENLDAEVLYNKCHHPSIQRAKRCTCLKRSEISSESKS